ncbi:hypothetical protein JCGZ_13038 [Jatropha curcas]|uniref:Uncharacterized protein n=1 Tax=Jatropha curcas TaxID=180498 RepID=A0A067KA57_JATCU|nr:hypothetical protein JCGZ_13038 [Jatropha curcas]
MSPEDEEEEEEEKEIDDEDERREKAIASTPPLQPNFKRKHVSQDQELHKRRLKLKSKVQKKSKDGTGRLHRKDLKYSDGIDSTRKIEESSVTNLKNHHDSINLSAEQDIVAPRQAPKKHQKLYWGLQIGCSTLSVGWLDLDNWKEVLTMLVDS